MRDHRTRDYGAMTCDPDNDHHSYYDHDNKHYSQALKLLHLRESGHGQWSRPKNPKVPHPVPKNTNIMKSIVPYLAVLLAIGLSACKGRNASPVATTCEKAAMELYCKYADNANLTVAYLGDLFVNGKCIDALMLQADNETDWETLKRDFGFMTYDTTVFDCPNDDNPFMVGVGIETDFLDDATLDTLTDISQIPDKDIERFTLIVAEKIREIMNSFQAPDSLLPSTAVIIGQGEIEHEAAGNSYDDYIMTVARTIVVGLINEKIASKKGGAPTGSATLSSMQQQKDWNESIMDDAQNHGHIGYITAADNDNRALWLFFYDDQEECNTIITHISEDIIINNN